MNKFILAVLIFTNVSCVGQSGEEKPKKPLINKVEVTIVEQVDLIKKLQKLKIASDSTRSYAEVKSSIKNQKLALNSRELSIDSIAIAFKRALVQRIIPFWEGTEWSFEGHTSIPNQGSVACGYFVSTTLKHAGLNINRYRLAQQSPIDEAKSLALNKTVIEIAESTTSENIARINESLKDGIHFIGFDTTHVGYILKHEAELYMIHSNYIDYKGVEIEKIEDSEVFSSYNRFFIAEISTNEDLLKSWVNGDEIIVIQRN